MYRTQHIYLPNLTPERREKGPLTVVGWVIANTWGCRWETLMSSYLWTAVRWSTHICAPQSHVKHLWLRRNQAPSEPPNAAPHSCRSAGSCWARCPAQGVPKGRRCRRWGEAWRELKGKLVAQALQDDNPSMNDLRKMALFLLFS